MAASGGELEGDEGEPEGSKMCNNQVFYDDWTLEQNCDETGISLDARCGRNKGQLEYLLNFSVPEINLKKEQQIIGCIPGDVMVAVLFPIHKQFYTDKKSSHFLKCGSKINFDAVLEIEHFWTIINGFIWLNAGG